MYTFGGGNEDKGKDMKILGSTIIIAGYSKSASIP
jgi:hypothetical protein